MNTILDSIHSYLPQLGLVLVALLALLMLGRRGRSAPAPQCSEVAMLRSDLRAMCSAAVAMGERVHHLERQLREMAARQEALGMRQEQMGHQVPVAEEQSYDHAIKLAHKGAGVADLIEVCGLTRGEAELVAMMHRLDKAS